MTTNPWNYIVTEIIFTGIIVVTILTDNAIKVELFL